MLADKFAEMFRVMQSPDYCFGEFQTARSELYQLLLKADRIISENDTICNNCLLPWPETETILVNGELGCSCGNPTQTAPDVANAPKKHESLCNYHCGDPCDCSASRNAGE